ncbi:4Fe-4S binding protein, partial [Armatimonadetes bacterium]|nr:4Fe-4S binding protein [bacterium]
YFHSVTLDKDECKGCTNCIKSCPTEAIRVRNGKATIINERCIDCGQCIKVCPYHAKKAITDSLDLLTDYKFNVALPAPSLYGQFKNTFNRTSILAAFMKIGFQDVFEVAYGAEAVTEATRQLLKNKSLPRPLISSACPSVVKLIQQKYPSLIEHVVKIKSPMEISAKMAREFAIKKTGLNPEEIGVFFISPCTAKVTCVKAPYEAAVSHVSAVISMKTIYKPLYNAISSYKESGVDLAKSSYEGIRWANSGGESLALGTDEFIAVDGIPNVITILEEIENDRLQDVEFVEALSCTGGCLGGPLAIENVYVAKTRLKKIIDSARETGQITDLSDVNVENMAWKKTLKPMPVRMLNNDKQIALHMLDEMNQIYDLLPKLDCGSCGSPNCMALSEDIVRGSATENDCIFKLREKVHELAQQMFDLELMSPRVFNDNRNKKKRDEKK